jgi:transcriptional regulator with XRE-family HTH domain
VRRYGLAARRKAVGLSQEQLAEQLGVDRSTVVRWESGQSEPQPWLRPRLGRVLQVSAEQLDALLAVAPVAGDDGDRLAHALAHPDGADLVTVAQLRQQVQELDEQYVHVASTLLLADTGRCLSQVAFLTAHARNHVVRRELCRARAEAAVLMGQLVWDASQRRDHASARAYLGDAVEAARQCGHQALEGLALLRQSMIALYGEKDPGQGKAVALHAAETAAGASRVLSGLAILHAAEACAMAGQATSCEKALTEAARQLGRVTNTDPAITLYSPSAFGRMAGSCYLSLNDARHAEALLEETAGALCDQSKSHGIVLGNLALASIQLGDLDAAAARLHEAIDVIEVNWGGGGLNTVFSAGRALLPWRTAPVVRDVHDRLLGLMAAGQGSS